MVLKELENLRNGNIVIDDTDVYIEVTSYASTKKTTEDILLEYDFSNWTVEDQRLLADMMGVTARQMMGESTHSEFVNLIDDAPSYVLEAYIDLLDNALLG